MKGFTLVELVVAIIVFFLFLAGICATLDVGLKSWQIGRGESRGFSRAEKLP